MRRVLRFALPAAAGIAALVVFALTCPRVPPDSRYELDIARVRELARSVPGPLPLRLNYTVVAEQTKPMLGVLGGLRFDSYRMVWTSFQVVYPDGSIVVDAPPDRLYHRSRSPDDFYDAEAFASVQQAMRRARGIFVTHEHPDHIGGIARSPYLVELTPRLHLTREQVASRDWLDRAGFPPAALDTLRALDVDPYHAAAPGLVLVKAPGHSPGSQLLFVHTAGGTEFLLVGDVAWHRQHCERPAVRPRISSWVLEEDIDAVVHQLRRLHDLAAREGIALVVSHDAAQLAEYAHNDLLGRGFE